jgi:tetratricopeptide (TPR) repeat protein
MRLVLVTLLLVGTAAPAWGRLPPGDEMVPAAREHLERGRRHYDVQEYDAAIAEFKAGYKIDPHPAFLYALGQAQRQRGDCRSAIRSYQTFLRTSPDERRAAAARENLARCEAALRAAPPGPQGTPATQPVVAPGPAPAPSPSPVPGVDLGRRRWYRDALGGTLTVAGLLAAGAGTVVWIMAHNDIEAARAASSYQDYGAHAAGAETRQIAGVVTVAVAGALLAAGIVRYLLLPAAAGPAVGAAPARGGGLVVVGGAF